MLAACRTERPLIRQRPGLLGVAGAVFVAEFVTIHRRSSHWVNTEGSDERR